jgi:hypothetical protein
LASSLLEFDPFGFAAADESLDVVDGHAGACSTRGRSGSFLNPSSFHNEDAVTLRESGSTRSGTPRNATSLSARRGGRKFPYEIRRFSL